MMRYARYLAILLAWLCSDEVPAMAEDLGAALSSLKAISTELATDRIERVDIFYMPYEKLTRTHITPEMLEVQADKMISQRLSSIETESLIRAIDSTTLHRIKETPDLRWGVVFFDRSGKRAHSIYLNSRYLFLGAGRKGHVDGIAIGLNSSLVNWLESHYLVK